MKRMGTLLALVLMLAVAMMSGTPTTAEAAACQAPDCFASPGCCYWWECVEFCRETKGGLPYCEGVQGNEGGCCACYPQES